MKRSTFIFILLAASIGCEPETTSEIIPTHGIFILNNGNWGDNDSSIGIYDVNDKTYVPDAFFAANGVKLGDLGQDMVIVDDRIYIAVYGSQTVFVTDISLDVITQINAFKDGHRLSPRHFDVSDGKIFITYYEGYAGEISQADHSVRLTETGLNPEGLAVGGKYLYVANSGGMAYPDYDHTLSVIALDSFEEEYIIEVNANPVEVITNSEGSAAYIFSYGDYTSYPSLVQVLDTETRQVSDLEYSSVSNIAKGKDDKLYILCAGYDEEWNPLPGKVYVHDMKRNACLGEFITDGTELPDAYSISCASDGYIYIGCSDYKNNGDMYVFDSCGRLHSIFDTQGLNPVLAY